MVGGGWWVGGLNSNIVSVPVPLGDLERPREARRVRDRKRMGRDQLRDGQGIEQDGTGWGARQ